MRKIYVMLILLASFTMVKGQYWRIYEADVLPLDTDGDTTASGEVLPHAFMFHKWSDKLHGAGFIEDIISDAQNEGNNILYYSEPSVESPPGSSKPTARGMYQHNFGDWADSNFTVLIRLAAIKGLESAFDIQWRNGSANSRDELYIEAGDSTLRFGKSSGSVKVNADLTRWHIIRVQVLGDSATVFLDENTTPVLASKTTSTDANKYIKFGDRGDDTHGAYVDYIMIDTTGGYTPAESAIPDSLISETGGEMLPGFGKNIAYVTRVDHFDADGFFADSMNVENLKAAGFNVTIPDYASAGALSDEFKTAITASDLVVIGRDISSSDFQGENSVYWEKLQKPVILMSPYAARSSHLRWLPTKDAGLTYARFGVLSGKVTDPTDAAFTGVSVGASDSIIAYCSDNVGMVNIYDSVISRISGEVLISLINGPIAYKISESTGDTTKTVDLAESDGMPLMLRWAPVTDSMYTGLSAGAAAARPFGWRTYFVAGDDHDAYYTATDTIRKYGLNVFSEAMKQVIVNEALYLLTLDVPAISDDNLLSALAVSTGTLSPDFSPEEVNYTLSLDAGTTEVTITPTLNDAKSTLDGGGVIPFDGSDTTVVITVTSEAGSVMQYTIVIKEKINIVGNVIPEGMGTIEEYLAQAADGDTFLLINGGQYVPLSTLVIDKDITLRAQDDPELPYLAGLPVILNDFAAENIFQLEDGAKLTLIGLDLDGADLASRCVSLRASTTNAKVELYINRCRLHNVTGDLIGGTRSDSVIVKKFTIQNSFLYEAGEHGAYIKDMYAEEGVNNDTYTWQDITFWNLAQQLVWCQNFPETASQTYVLDHMTGFNLSTLGDKELIGNSDGGGQYNITLTNSIFSEQPASTEVDLSSLYFTTQNSNGDDNVLTIRNLVLYNVNAVNERSGSGTIDYVNILEADPQFANPASEDFTIGNSDYLAAGDDGSIIGARYWHPDFVDYMCDLYPDGENCGGVGVNDTRLDLNVEVYPIPFNTVVNFSIPLDKADNVTISIVDVTGRTIMLESVELESGMNRVSVNTSTIDTGTYFFTITTSMGYSTGSLIKAE
ncbi:MAG: DUF4957 domain-containing protein [Bacteroidales bacterium]|nr:DUF4957 domain-containing protein [Bacteroidales bacterium]MBN2817523.1 DUF4957 domain-containing protein [Bacteroidales bacterium]